MSGALAPGIYVQVYRAKVAGKTRAARLAECAARLDLLAAAGVRGIAWHGFSAELDGDAFAPLATLCHERNLAALAAYGMDASDPTGKGRRIGAVAARPDCDGVVLDAEGAFDNNATAAAQAIGAGLRAAAPHALAVTQPWPLPQFHSHFPYAAFAAYTDAVAPQYYVNDWTRQYGAARYKTLWPRFEAAWQHLEATTLAGAVRPRFPTIQGYGWSDIPADLEQCLAANPTVLIWCEPWPEPCVLAAIRNATRGVCAQPAAG